MGRGCALGVRCARLGHEMAVAAALLCLLGWAKKTVRSRGGKKERKSRDRSSSSSLLPTYWNARGRPGMAREDAGKLAGSGDGLGAVHRGQGRG